MDNQLDSESHCSSSIGFNFDDDATEVANVYSSIDDFLDHDDMSEASFDNSMVLDVAHLSIRSVISDAALKAVLTEQTLDDVVIAKDVSVKEELKLLRRQIQTMVYSPSVELSATKLLCGKTCQLEAFKSLHEKRQLLRTVLANGGGDAVTGVVLFLKRTLNKDNFESLLLQHPSAMEHYISYLGQRHEAELYEMLRLCKRDDDVCLQTLLSLMDGATNTNANVDADADAVATQRQMLWSYLRRNSDEKSVHSFYRQIFQNMYELMDFVGRERATLGADISWQQSPLEVLYACCSKQSSWRDAEQMAPPLPHRLCSQQRISAAQFEWTALNQRARAHVYADMPCLFERTPNWQPRKQFHISFSVETAIMRLYDMKAPPSVLYMFVSKMGNASEKLDLSQKVKCTKGVIDALASLKDATQLAQLMATLPDRSDMQIYCEHALKTLQSKRWPTDIKIKL